MFRSMISSKKQATSPRLYRAVGLMSGTSMDGVDAALLETDGVRTVRSLGFVTVPYPPEFRDRVRAVLGHTRDDADGTIKRLARDLTDHHLAAVLSLLAQTGVQANQVDVIGFHGQTITHLPAQKFTWQIGDPGHLAKMLGVKVVFDLRVSDVAAGGQGAPLLPIYHQALTARAGLALPVVLLNLGGVGNITYIGQDDGDLMAFDTGPGNALIDDLMRARAHVPYDIGGRTALSGTANRDVLAKLMDHPYFAAKPPKSLDRNDFTGTAAVEGLSTADAAATLAAFTVRSVLAAFDHLPQCPTRVLVTGGGRHNAAIMAGLSATLPCPVESVDVYRFNGDAMEAEGFAYMAVRCLNDLPISFPGTTGAPRAMTGGKVYQAR
jgi:anhydro-N-acetylmuramic acid kinase